MTRTLAFSFLAFSVISASANDGPPTKSAELDVLSRYVGVWELTFDAESPFSGGTLAGQWVLGGAYLEEIGELTARFVPEDVAMKAITTYDAGKRRYERWVFLSNGRNLRSTGTWDSKTSTMTWTSDRFESQSKRTVRTRTTEEFRKDDTLDVSKVSRIEGREVGRSLERRTLRK